MPKIQPILKSAIAFVVDPIEPSLRLHLKPWLFRQRRDLLAVIAFYEDQLATIETELKRRNLSPADEPSSLFVCGYRGCDRDVHLDGLHEAVDEDGDAFEWFDDDGHAWMFDLEVPANVDEPTPAPDTDDDQLSFFLLNLELRARAAWQNLAEKQRRLAAMQSESEPEPEPEPEPDPPKPEPTKPSPADWMTAREAWARLEPKPAHLVGAVLRHEPADPGEKSPKLELKRRSLDDTLADALLRRLLPHKIE
jgi:hypothetical protein